MQSWNICKVKLVNIKLNIVNLSINSKGQARWIWAAVVLVIEIASKNIFLSQQLHV